MDLVLDLEADGLLKDATKLWCAVAYDIHQDKYYEFDTHEGNYEDLIHFLDHATCWIGHNIIDYDIPLLRKLGVYNYSGFVCDTLIMSRALNPDRKLPRGCPTHILDPSTGKQKVVGSQGLEAWGYRVSNAKPYIERWDEWDPKMLHRCKEDVKINYLTLNALLEEAELDAIPRVKL